MSTIISAPPIPPAAPIRTRTFELHGEHLTDDYPWLRDRQDSAVLAYLEAENAYARTALDPYKALEDKLYEEMVGRIKQTDLTVPYRDRGFWYYSRTEEGKQYSIYCRKRGTLDAPEEVLLDLNQLIAGRSFIALGTLMVSPDGRLLAYSTDPTGFREYTLVVKDLETGQLVAGPIERAGSVAWAGDSETIFYTIEDDAKRDSRLFRLTLGQDAVLVYEEPDEHFRIGVGETRSRAYLVLEIESHTSSETRVLRADEPAGTWSVVHPRRPDIEYDLDHHGDEFLIRINDRGKNFRVVRAPIADPSPSSWVEILPHRPDVMIDEIDCFAGHWVAWERARGLPQIRITEFAAGESRYVEFSEAAYDVRRAANEEWDTPLLRYAYESFITPTSIFDYDVRTGRSTLLKQKEVLGGYDPTQYVSERHFATASDGAVIPISLVRRRDQSPELAHPLYLTGYGAYGVSYPVAFNPNRLSLLDRGVMMAIAHIRGGGDLGGAWHDAGRMANKMNTFTDFIASAEHLIAAGRTRSDQLVIEGGSAGGLLMGAVINLRPDLAAAALLMVPFVDVINTMLDPSLPLTVGEYEEWGNPAVAEQYGWIRRYCPYTNLAPGGYPAMLVRTSLNDSQVMYWEPAKYVAKLRRLKTDAAPLLLLTNLGAGHGGASGRYDRLREIATDYAFVLWQLGIE
jgi:oligopeptidase B